MPMPNPNKKKENLAEFVSRFMSDTNMNKDFPDRKQRLAIAYSKYRENKPKK